MRLVLSPLAKGQLQSRVPWGEWPPPDAHPLFSSPYPRKFSHCSRTDLQTFLEKPHTSCLDSAPDPDRLVGGPVCGNGFLERGEQCDCGQPQVQGLAPSGLPPPPAWGNPGVPSRRPAPLFLTCQAPCVLACPPTLAVSCKGPQGGSTCDLPVGRPQPESGPVWGAGAGPQGAL